MCLAECHKILVQIFVKNTTFFKFYFPLCDSISLMVCIQNDTQHVKLCHTKVGQAQGYPNLKVLVLVQCRIHTFAKFKSEYPIYFAHGKICVSRPHYFLGLDSINTMFAYVNAISNFQYLCVRFDPNLATFKKILIQFR